LIIADSPVIAPLAVTLGDPAGIGPEIIGKAWSRSREENLPSFFVVGDAAALRKVWDGPLEVVTTAAEAAAIFGKALPLIQMSDAMDVVPGQPSLETARCALDTLGLAVGLARVPSLAWLPGQSQRHYYKPLALPIQAKQNLWPSDAAFPPQMSR
jgi:4-hydroxythreonine-4-phosphate dehydrogenase